MKSRVTGALLTLFEGAGRGTSLTAQLKSAIADLIFEKAVADNDRLPSTRALARDLNMSRDTVEAAYQQLEAEGYVVRRTGSGTFVKSPTQPVPWSRGPADAGRVAAPGKTARMMPLSARGIDIEIAGGVVDQATVRPFAAGMPDVDSFPIDVWQRLSARAMRDSGRSLLTYGDAQGYGPLREEIWRHLTTHRGVSCSPDQILVLTSSQQALTLIATLLFNPGEVVGIEDPGYHGAKLAFLAAGAFLKPVPVDADGLVVSALDDPCEPVRAVYVTPSHQYPTGVSLSTARRKELLFWSHHHGSWIIEDDYDSEYHYDGQPIASLQGIDASARVIYTGTFNKVLFPSLRLAYVVLPPQLMKAFVSARTLLDGQTSLLHQRFLCEFMRDGHFAAHIRNTRALYRGRRDLFLANLERHLGSFVSFRPPKGGLSIACYLRPGLTEALTVRLASTIPVELPTLRRLYLGGNGPEGWLLGFAALRPEVASRAMIDLAAAISASSAVR